MDTGGLAERLLLWEHNLNGLLKAGVIEAAANSGENWVRVFNGTLHTWRKWLYYP